MLQPGIYHPFFFWAPGRVVLAKMSAFVRRVRLTRLCMPMVLPHAKFLVRAVRHCVFRSQQDLLLSAAASVMSMIGRRPTFNAVMRVSETGSVACAIPRWYDPASAIRKRRLRQITQAISSTKCSSVGPRGTYSSTSPFRSASYSPLSSQGNTVCTDNTPCRSAFNRLTSYPRFDSWLWGDPVSMTVRAVFSGSPYLASAVGSAPKSTLSSILL